MDRLITGLRAFAEVGNGGSDPEPISLATLAHEVCASLGEQATDAGAVLTVQGDAIALGDRALTRQILQNLVSNAIKFTSTERRPEVLISSEVRGDVVAISVSDNGIGMPEEALARIFEMFSRLHRRGEYEGSGIGLALAKRIVEMKGGRIEVESELGVGTTFCVLLPGVGTESAAVEWGFTADLVTTPGVCSVRLPGRIPDPAGEPHADRVTHGGAGQGRYRL